MKNFRIIGVPAFLALTTSVLGLPSNVDSAHKYAWTENCGWTNWRDANTGIQGVQVQPTFLRGWIWAENAGWIDTGHGNAPYANTNNTNFGINVDGAGNMTGFAWSENAGWINFAGGSLATPANPARIDLAAERLRGFAWSENLGWINLDDGASFVAFVPACPGDVDGDGFVGLSDIAVLITNWTNGVPPAPASADQDNDGVVGLGDVAIVIRHWGTVCP